MLGRQVTSAVATVAIETTSRVSTQIGDHAEGVAGSTALEHLQRSLVVFESARSPIPRVAVWPKAMLNRAAYTLLYLGTAADR